MSFPLPPPSAQLLFALCCVHIRSDYSQGPVHRPSPPNDLYASSFSSLCLSTTSVHPSIHPNLCMTEQVEMPHPGSLTSGALALNKEAIERCGKRGGRWAVLALSLAFDRGRSKAVGLKCRLQKWCLMGAVHGRNELVMGNTGILFGHEHLLW